ncbi:hypothetical protein HV436_01055 [Bacillus sporothermodurans]|nr:hypothetical protein [Heyndrickxia sporothermodurans]MBL5844914.1 hypothetical protein [Heyndrickxia sporothermodurans]
MLKSRYLLLNSWFPNGKEVGRVADSGQSIYVTNRYSIGFSIKINQNSGRVQ